MVTLDKKLKFKKKKKDFKKKKKKNDCYRNKPFFN